MPTAQLADGCTLRDWLVESRAGQSKSAIEVSGTFPSFNAMSTFGTTAAAPAAAGGWAIALRRCRAQRVGITSSAAASSSGRGATEGEEEGPPDEKRFGFGRRDALISSATACLSTGLGPECWTAARASTELDAIALGDDGIPDYTVRGPYGVRRLPKLEHTCISCFPRCVGDACLVQIDAYVPSAPPPLPDTMFPLLGEDGVPLRPVAGPTRGALSEVSRGPYPLAVFTSGFLVDSEATASYCRRLCSWGYVVLGYNKRDGVGVAGGNALDDVVSAQMVDDLIGWARTDVLLAPLVRDGGAMDTADETDDDIVTAPAKGGVYLLGHSRGGKISVLQACGDERVRAACLLDPVDNTVYAPLGEGFPSAVAKMRNTKDGGPPLLVVGGKYGGDCAPKGSNYLSFLEQSNPKSWGVEVRAGHFQFLDSATLVQRAVCEENPGVADAQVREVSQALMVAHAETVFRGVPREAALRRTMKTLEQSWGDGAFDRVNAQVAPGQKSPELPWVLLRDGISSA